MGCNCNKVVTAPASKFGSCTLCMYVTLSGFLCSWLLILPFLFVPISTTLFVVLSLPAAFFTVWLSLHLAASYRMGISGVYLSLGSFGSRKAPVSQNGRQPT